MNIYRQPGATIVWCRWLYRYGGWSRWRIAKTVMKKFWDWSVDRIVNLEIDLPT